MRQMQNTSGIVGRAMRRGLAALAAGLCLAAAAVRAQTTTNNVTWDGGGGAGNPYWSTALNWASDLAPTNPTAATVAYNAGGQSVTGVLDAAYSIGRLSVSAVAANHVIDIGGYDGLTLAGNLENAIQGVLTFRNGTLRIGSDAVWGNITLGSSSGGHAVSSITRIDAGTTFDPYRLDTIKVGNVPIQVNGGNAQLDLRGVTIQGGELRAKTIRVLAHARGPMVSYLALDSTTGIDALVVSNELTIGEGSWGGRSYIGDPADSPRFRLPPGLDIRVGTGPAQRGSLQVGKNAVAAGVGNITLDAILAARSGGSFTGYLSSLKVVPYEASYTENYPMNGLLDLSSMDSCSIDVQTLLVAPNYSLNTFAQPRGTLRLGSATVTARTAEIGAASGAGFGMLQLSNTVFAVTNAFTIAKTGWVTNYLGGLPKGIDVDGTFTDGGGKIHVVFTEAPAVATNWAIRVAGNAQKVLHGMVGSGRLTASGSFTGWKTGVIYDGTYTYYTMVDESIPFATAAVAKDAAFEIEPGGTVYVDISEVDAGSYDPDGRSPVAVTMSSGGADVTSLSFDAVDNYPVTVKIEVGDPVVETATDAATVHVVALDSGTTANRTWFGAASTVLMDRREWWWKGSWLEGTPPANPTTGTITFQLFGQTVVSLLEQDRRIGGLTVPAGYTHTLNLGGRVLTVAGILNNQWGINVTNGTLKIGSDDVAGTLRVGLSASGGGISTLRMLPGSTLDTRRTVAIQLGNIPPTHVNDQNARLDLRGASVAGGVLSASNLLINCTYRNETGSYVALDATTMIDAIVVSNELVIGSGSYGGLAYIGNPAASATGYRLPPGLDFRVGVSASRRGSLQIGRNSGLNDATRLHTALFTAGAGGVFEAYVTYLKVVPYEATYHASMSTAQNGTLDLAAMDLCAVDAQTILVAPNYSANASAQPRGTLRLPSGTVTAGTVEVGANIGTGFGLLETSNTVFAVTNTITLRKTAVVTNRIASVSSGLDIVPTDAGALSVHANARLVLRFLEPAASKPHYGLRWAGDHKTTLDDMIDDGRLVIDDDGLGREATVFVTGGFTYVGLKPAGGTVLTVR